MKRLLFLASLLCLQFFVVCAQEDSRVYLGEGMDSLFDSSSIKTDSSGNFPLLSFAGYSTRLHTEAGKEADTLVNREGFLLAAKSTESDYLTGNAVFGNEKNSSIINYKITTEVVHHGRSFLMSVSNLAGGNQPQKPYDRLKSRQEEGFIKTGSDTVKFYHAIENRDYPKLHGWLITGNDTLTLEPAPKEQRLKSGKIKSRIRRAMEAMQLMKAGTCVAAFDKHYRPYTVYIAKQLSEKEKLIIAAYFFVLAVSSCSECP